MTSSAREQESTRTLLLRIAGLAAIYVLLARIGLSIHAISRFATLIWAPTGVALAALLLFGRRLWPGILLGAVIVNVWAGAPVAVALGIAAGNTLEALFAVWTLKMIPGFRSTLDRLVDVIALLVLGGVFSAMISATIGTASLLTGGLLIPAHLPETWRAWWLGDAIGDFVVAPILLTWSAARAHLRWTRVLEAAALGALLVLASLYVFEMTNHGVAALLSPLLVWAAVRFGQRGAARSTFLVSLIAIWATSRGHGVFGRATVEEGLFTLQEFLALNAATFLVLGAVVSERKRAEKQRRLAEAAIRESEDRYRTLIDAVDQLIWINDPTGAMRYANRRWQERLGVTLEQSEGLLWLRLVHPEDRSRVTSANSRAIESGEPYHVEFRIRTVSGEYRWMLARVAPLKDENGAVRSWFGGASDIHDLKLAEERLRKAKEQAESANRAKDQFLAALSHELRTPLTPVLAFSSVLERDPRLPSELKRNVEAVRRNAELEARLIDDLLDLTRIARGKLQLEPEPVDIEESIKDTLEICRDGAEEKHLRVVWERPEGRARVLADPARLRQIFWNLVKNAIKFTPAGGELRIRTLAPTPDRLAVEVSDTGAGIEPSQLERIFHPFEQGEGGSGGLGLGLSISRALAEAHGGRLTASSAGPGLGATFRVELEALRGEEPAPVPPHRTGIRSAPLSPRSILVVEDHADTLRAECEILRELAFEVVGVGTVAAALAAAQKQGFDVVLSDLGLPDGTGHDLMLQLRERHGLTGIAVTGYGMEDDVRRSREAGFVEHVVKPITFQRLSAAVSRFFSAQKPGGAGVAEAGRPR